VPWPDIAERLRRELRDRGQLSRHRGEYVRIRTRRFEISLKRRPTDNQVAWVKDLRPLRRKRGAARGRSKRQQKG
jgi:hypothetical protein